MRADAGDPDYLNGTRKVKYVHIGKDAVFKDNKAIFDFGGNGGAIEVQSGELSIDDGVVFTGNTSNNTGGAISICNSEPATARQGGVGTGLFHQEPGHLWRCHHQRGQPVAEGYGIL